jgi:hypothetical protein
MFIKLEDVNLKMLTAMAYDNVALQTVANACVQIMRSDSTYTVEAGLSQTTQDLWQLDSLHVF